MKSPLTLARRLRPEWPRKAQAGTERRIAYLANVFPYATETFVYRELLALRARGCTILPFSLRAPEPNAVSSEALPLLAETYSVLPVPLGEFSRAHVGSLFRHPMLYFATLIAVVSGTHLRARDRLRSLAHWAEAITLVPVLQRAGVDHIHAHFAVGAATCASVAARFLDVPWSFTAHAYDIWLDKLLLPEKLRDAAQILTCSEVNREYLLSEYEVGPDKVHTVYHGIDVDHFSPGPPRAPSDAPARILCVGRLVEQKGIVHLLDACAKLTQQGADFELVIAGDGPLRETLEAQAETLGLGSRTRFIGHVFQDELLALYRSFDLFVLPCVPAHDGDRDGVPNVLIEAMACGLCVVSTDFSGVPELVQDGTSGSLVPPADSESLADAIQALLDDPAWREKMAHAGREAVVSRFAIEVSAQALLEATGWDLPAETPGS